MIFFKLFRITFLGSIIGSVLMSIEITKDRRNKIPKCVYKFFWRIKNPSGSWLENIIENIIASFPAVKTRRIQLLK